MANNIVNFQAATSYIFDRRVTAAHPWSKALTEIETSADITRQAVFSNWRMDYRVAKDREDRIINDNNFDCCDEANQWFNIVRSNYLSSLCRPYLAPNAPGCPVYLDKCNQVNHIQRHTIPPFDQLVHVGSLNRILLRLANSEQGFPTLAALEFEDRFGISMPGGLPGSQNLAQDDFNSQVDKIAESLLNKGVVKGAAGFFCDALGDSQPPWWACFAEDINKLIQDNDWVNICRALGLGHIKDGEWLFLWRYDVGHVMDICRPTVIEANDNPFHFPSPPNCQFGVTMPLSSTMRRCREVIHPPLKSEQVNEGIVILGKIESAPIDDYQDIGHLRQIQRNNLQTEFTNADNINWLERHNGIL